MASTLRATSRNVLANSRYYPQILQEYQRRMQINGKVNGLEFHREVIAPLLPEYSIQSWYQFLKRFKTTAGLIAAQVTVMPTMTGEQAEAGLERVLATNQAATEKGIKHALNLGAKFYEELWKKYNEAPETLTVFEQGVLKDALFKAMKAQDSRIAAHGKIREDGREQAKFDRAFGDAAY